MSPDTFDVDLAARAVTHSSGVIFSFREYEREEDWRATDAIQIEQEHLCRGDINELARRAKAAALKAGMTRKASMTPGGPIPEPPSARHARLRRVVILCSNLLENAAYYRAIAACLVSGRTTPTRPLIVASNNYLDVAVTTWCKLFGSDRERHHWTRIITDPAKREAFKRDLYAELGCDEHQWKDYCESMLKKRDKFLAHQDDENEETHPVMDIAIASAKFLHRYIMENEHGSGSYAGLQVDADAWYARCLAHNSARAETAVDIEPYSARERVDFRQPLG